MLKTRTHHRFSVDSYERMVETGILTKYDKVELIRGEILLKRPIGDRVNGVHTSFLDGDPVSTMPMTKTHHRFSVDDYERMVKTGILTESDHVELIRGEILEKMTIGDPHCACVNRLNRYFSRHTEDSVLVSVQNPIRLADSAPEPDLMLLVRRDDFYSSRKPLPDDILLLIEVSDSSLDYDRNGKGPLYAENGIREFWIVNLIDDCVEIHRDPQADGTWRDVRVARRGEQVEVAALAGLTVAVSDVIG